MPEFGTSDDNSLYTVPTHLYFIPFYFIYFFVAFLLFFFFCDNTFLHTTPACLPYKHAVRVYLIFHVSDRFSRNRIDVGLSVIVSAV